MRLERERKDGRRDFWEIKVKKQALEIKAGIVNIRHKVETQKFPTGTAAKAARGKLVAAKLRAGFAEPIVLGSQFLPEPWPTNPELEAAIREDRSDPGPYGVYADWLQTRGAEVGELVALAAAIERRPDRRKQQLFAALAGRLALPTAEFATFGYRHGFWQWLRFENAKDWMESKFEPAQLAQKLFSNPLCAALDELRLGILRWDHNYEDVPAVLAIAGGFAWSKTLSRLHVGDVTDQIDMAHHVIGDVGRPITKGFPALRWLKLHSGSQTWRGGAETFGVRGLELPQLETLIVETCAMTKLRLKHLLAAQLPALTRLELWFGSPGMDCTATVRDLEPLLGGKLFPRLRHLALVNHEFTDALIARLADSPLAARLHTLDLSKSTLDDASAPALAALAPRFGALEVLDVDDNFLTSSGLRALRAAFAGVKVVSTAQDKLVLAGEPDDRFCSVHE